MSPRAAAEFSKQWPALQRRLRAFLRGKSVGAGEIDDLVQEVATRLLSFWHKLDRDKPVWPLTATIALNLLRDRNRKADLEVLGELPDIAASFDAARLGIARMELADVLRAMDELTPAQRNALLNAIEPDQDGERSTSAEKMLRLRARKRLANAVGRACGVFGLKVRRVGDALHALFSKSDAVAQAFACATCLFVTTAGAASLYPEMSALGIDGVTARPATTVSVSPQSATSLITAGTSTNSEVLSPEHRAAYSERSGDEGPGTGRREGSAAADEQTGTSSGNATPGTNIPLPDQPPTVPGGDAPIPAPSPPDAPSTAPEPGVESGGSVPEGSPLQAPSDVPTATVETVTGTLNKAGR